MKHLIFNLIIFTFMGKIQTLIPVNRIRNAATGLYLESNSTQNVYTAKLSSSSSSKFQNWTILINSDDYTATFKNVATGLCLASKINGNNVLTLTCNGGSSQRWILMSRKIYNSKTRRALESDEKGMVFTSPPNQSASSQTWKIEIL